MKKNKILIIDDEAEIGRLFQKSLPEFSVLHASTGREGIEIVQRERPNIVFLDLKLPDMPGEKVLKKVKQLIPGIVVVILTGYAEVDTAVKTMKLGAYDYLTKPLPLQRLKIIVKNAMEVHILDREVKELRDDLSKTHSIDRIITINKKMQETLNLVQKAARHNITVLITGESGTGKELIARAIHHESDRKDSPFIAVDCASLPETLIESELFGYEKGAFTGANEVKSGKFELAHTGTIFLDEIGNLSDSLQIKLLRVLQEREIVRLGGKKTVPVDVRVVAATNRDLPAMVKNEKFRDDLYYRLNVFSIKLPPLRDRMNDIVPLSKNFLERFNREFDREIEGITAEATEVFHSYSWPGNIRELENVIKSAVILADNFILPEHLNGLIVSETEPGDTTPEKSLKDVTKKAEKKLIEKVLAECKWNKRKTAKQLGIDYKTLYNKVKEYGI